LFRSKVFFGKGTTFWFTIPVQQDLTASKKPKKRKSSPQISYSCIKEDNKFFNKPIGRKKSDFIRSIHQVSSESKLTNFNFIPNEFDDENLKRTLINEASHSVVRNERYKLLHSLATEMNKKISSKVELEKIERIEDGITTRRLGEKKRCECPEILVVDDNPFNLMVIKSLISSKLEVKCDQSLHGKQGLDKVLFAENRDCCGQYKLVLLDLDMPVMNGYETAEALKHLMKEDKISKLMIVALTAYASKEAKDKCIEVGMDNYLTKPVVFEELEEILKNFNLII